MGSGRATISPTTFLPELQLLCPVDGYYLSSEDDKLHCDSPDTDCLLIDQIFCE